MIGGTGIPWAEMQSRYQKGEGMRYQV